MATENGHGNESSRSRDRDDDDPHSIAGAAKPLAAAAPVLIRIYGDRWSECGYCRGARAPLVQRPRHACSQAFNIVLATATLPPTLYEAFVHRGWRRCGVSLYKPANEVSCCPQLSLRLPVQDFCPTKSQKKVERKLAAALRQRPSQAAPLQQPPAQHRNHNSTTKRRLAVALQTSWTREVEAVLGEIWNGDPTTTSLATAGKLPIVWKERPRASSRSKQTTDRPTKEDPATVCWATSVCAALAGRSRGQLDRGVLAAQLAAGLRARLLPGSAASTNNNNNTNGPAAPQAKKSKSAAAMIEETGVIQRIEHHAKSGQVWIHLQPTVDESCPHTATRDVSAEKEPGTMDTNDDDDDDDKFAAWWSRRTSQPVPPPGSRTLTVETLPSHTSALDPAVFSLYAAYQHLVHGDADPLTQVLSQDDDNDGDDDDEDDAEDAFDPNWGSRAPTEWRSRLLQVIAEEFGHLAEDRRRRVLAHYVQFYEFLVDNPFPAATSMTGTLHQHYRINGVLVAVGVVDVLPTGLSSVYVFYDADFSHSVAPLGKYTVLREIAWAREQGLPYYYLGFYIESCPKMRYKADYAPSQLLCPKTATWVPAVIAQSRLIQRSPERHCSALVADEKASNHLDDATVQEIVSRRLPLQVGLDHPLILADLPPEAVDLLTPFLRDFLQLAGPELAQACVFDFR
jgi:arginine-tRNA-protein transferase